MPIVPAPLLLLGWLRTKALFRRIFKGMKSIRGCLMTLFFLFMICSWLPFAIMGGSREDGAQGLSDFAQAIDIPAERIPAVGLLWGCLLMLALPARGPGIQFRANEIEFLFTGPFRRRHLVTFKLVALLGGLLYLVSILALFSFRYSPGGYPQAFAALFMTFGFVYLFRICISMLAQSVMARLHTRFRMVATVALLSLVLLSIYPLLAARAAESSAGLRPVVLWLSTPFVPFANLMLAEHFVTGFLPAAAIALGMNVALALFILRLDVDYRDAALKQAQEVQSKLDRIRKSGASLSSAPVKNVRVTIPQLPRMGGAGAILWRQLVTARRHGTKLLVIMLGVPVIMVAIHLAGYGEVLKAVGPAFIGLVFIVPQLIQFDFRSDIDKMGWLKTLPIPPIYIAAGQLATPVLLATLIYVLAVGTYAVLTQLWLVFLGTVLFLPPAVALMYCIDNFLFLHYPLPPIPSGADPRQMFQLYVVLIAKVLSLALFAGIAAGLGGIAHWLTSSVPVAFVVVFIALMAELVPCVIAVGAAFRGFDINRIPGE